MSVNINLVCGVLVHCTMHIVPCAKLFLDFKLTGRKKLRDEFETQDTILLILQYTINDA
jgi:hypothetical protein